MPETASLDRFLQHHRLPESYAGIIHQYIAPIAAAISARQQQLRRPLIVGVNGSQGSGKTTLSDALVMLLQETHQCRSVAISIDDFYLTQAERQTLARDVHPLLATRGVPGTHDIGLARDTIHQLTQGSATVAVPRFDKAVDDRAAVSVWDNQQAPLNVVILEGWCVGALPQSEEELVQPVNTLEADEDADGHWRHYVNACLQNDYTTLWQLFDLQVMLKAPSFDCVYRWRKEQEDKLREKVGGNASGIMSDAEIARFIQHYQRITEHNLQQLPGKVQFLLELDEQRQITGFSQPLSP